LWIASADAAFLSLEPKPQEKPLFTAFRLNDNRMSFQYRYLLDSFTPESLGKLFTFSPPGIPDTPDKKRSPTIRAFRNKMSESMLFFMASHDSGFDTKNIREKRSANFRTHSSPASPAHYVTKGMYRTYISSITAQAKPAFEYFRKYHAQQLTSLPILGNNIDDSTGKSLRHLTRSSADALQTVFFARSFASQLCRDNPIPDLPQEHKPLYPVQDTSFQDAGREPSIDKRMRS
jgi:hypothetical protein